MRRFQILFFSSLFFCCNSFGQAPKTYTSSELLQQVKKLNVLGSVLYIAAHPDDERTGLLAWLANEKLYRTAYLSITRGDGGQNLIGDEQGTDLGLIRTQELLAARRIDGAEQFFTRAYDFGYSKDTSETLRFWDKRKILADVVWVIRKFRPDVIITRFSATAGGTHAHHTASAILVEEAFTLSGDPEAFPEQFAFGVKPWKAKRLLWNTYSFNSTSTQNENQFKIDAGGFNALLGKSYGEIAAESRSQHKSQGFGVARSRGSQLEYFATIKGSAPINDLMEGVVISWQRVNHPEIEREVDAIANDFSIEDPATSLKPLLDLYKKLSADVVDPWTRQKIQETENLIEYCSGLYMEVTTEQPFAVRGDSLRITATINNRQGADIQNLKFLFKGKTYSFDKVPALNTNLIQRLSIPVTEDEPLSIPYWLIEPISKGNFNVSDQRMIGLPESEAMTAIFTMEISGVNFQYRKPVLYKSNDPVKGELYQPVFVVNPVSITAMPEVSIAKPGSTKTISFLVKNYKEQEGSFYLGSRQMPTWPGKMKKGYNRLLTLDLEKVKSKTIQQLHFENLPTSPVKKYSDGFRIISYPHIPDILVPTKSSFTVKTLDLKISGKDIGYIPGAGDKVPEALKQMGYKVTLLEQKDITDDGLKNFDAVVTGVRAYNVHEWLSDAYDALMNYVKEGGVLLVQYNTNSNIGPVKANISPYPFTISRNRVTDEEAEVRFVDSAHRILNHPNKITKKDFEGWIQERSVYHAEGFENNYQAIFSMNDPGETEQQGSLIVANYGKGKFVYAALALFRQLPAGVTGAYRLMANLLAKPD